MTTPPSLAPETAAPLAPETAAPLPPEVAAPRVPAGGAFPLLERLLEDRDPEGWAERVALGALLAEGQGDAAHQRAAALAEPPPGHPAVVGFDLAEGAGRRGARRLLRQVRRDAAAEAPLLPPAAHGPVEAWAHFRLWRHGRALALAQEALAAGRAASPAGSAGALVQPREEACPPLALGAAALWIEALDAIRGLALRQGYLRHAQTAHGLAAGFATTLPEPPDRRGADQEMAALEELLGGHRRHGLRGSLLRYLARSLGHPGDDSLAAAAEVARDLGVTPEQLAAARALAERLGLPPRVTARLREIEERTFAGHGGRRRQALRVLLVVFWGLVAGLLALGLTLLQHAL